MCLDKHPNCSYKKNMGDLKWIRNGILFVCHAEKRGLNLRKHGIDLIRARVVFEDPFSFSFFDEAHSEREERYGVIGKADNEILLCVIHTFRGETVRLISARKANNKEANQYAER